MKKIFISLCILSLLFGCSKEEDLSKPDDNQQENQDPNNNTPYDFPIRPISEKSNAYVSELLDYSPAPGQFINTSLGNLEAAQKLVGGRTSTVSLGGYGGSITLAFDHTVLNKDGEDIIVYSNAFAGSSEPGVVEVSIDVNKNGKADDPWYTLKGSVQTEGKEIQNYIITYHNPHKDQADIPWTDNQGGEGAIKYLDQFHSQPYWPEDKRNEETLEIKGVKLPSNKSVNEAGVVELEAFDWGYVDNFSKEYSSQYGNSLDIANAIDNDGNAIDLPGIDFIKVYTGVNVDADILGEASTEVAGIADIHLLKSE